MLATMNTSSCPTSTESSKPDVLVNVVAPHQPEQPIPVDGTTNNVIEDSTTSITTSEIYQKEKPPIPKKIMTIMANKLEFIDEAPDVLDKPKLPTNRDSEMETSIPETVLQEMWQMPSTKADEKMAIGEIQKFARQMTKAVTMLDPEIIDRPKIFQLDFTREVKVGESLKKTKSYTLIASYSLIENVMADEENQVDDSGEKTEIRGVRFCGVYDDLNTPADFENYNGATLRNDQEVSAASAF
ncbi:hypothetical protein DAPPUDRAFT_235501 [Daphnia pulex]|uniref:Uncharacterized protein n=1 Tax=Daphnia pulex TaxID=6669 RepID=E9FZ45_DAPPU|nr:hypothetical protein DAPPUDRAFT_235501 [Daphnia pulex]|eukprot:EFX87663.1 hypothetical protein DAPPUDRAFT_235501 [Daphnia pulex]